MSSPKKKKKTKNKKLHGKGMGRLWSKAIQTLA